MMPEFAEVSLAQTVGLESAADGLLSNGPSCSMVRGGVGCRWVP